jgi:translation initiation factor 2 subunit 2
MEDFEKELGGAPSPKPKKPKKEESDEEGEDGGDDDEADFDEIEEVDEEELGENPFAAGAAGGRDAESEPWIGSDRDYTYEEVRFYLHLFYML